MNAGHFNYNHVSTGDLNRPRSPEVRKPLVYFWYFSYTRKVRKTSLLQEASRFCKPRISARQPQLPTATIKTFQGSIEVLQTSMQHTQTTTSHNPIKSFLPLRGFFSVACSNRFAALGGTLTAKGKSDAGVIILQNLIKIISLFGKRVCSILTHPYTVSESVARENILFVVFRN